jgi:transcriptional regulator with XRE-family HTH domain
MRVDADFIDRLARGDDAAVRFLRPIVRKCVKSAIAKMPASKPLMDDIEQDTWIFIIRHARRIDPQYNIEPYLIKVASNMAMQNMGRYGDVDFSLTQENDEEGSGDYRQEMGIAGLDGRQIGKEFAEWPSGGDPFVEDLSRRNALEFLRKQSHVLQQMQTTEVGLDHSSDTDGRGLNVETREMSGGSDGVESDVKDVSLNHPPRDAGDHPRQRKPKELGQDKVTHRQLRDIRLKLGLSQVEMAEKLGVKLPTYQSYEYGKTRRVNEDVLMRARQLAADDDYSYVREKFAGKTMDEIARHWAERLGIEPDRVTDLASTIGVNKSTVSRWLANSQMPNVWELIRYEDIVSRQERRLRAGLQQQESRQTQGGME